MQPDFSGATDPTPYIIMAYTIGSLLLLGFAAQTVRQRAKLRALLAAVKKGA